VRPSALPIAGSRRGTVLLGLPAPLLLLWAEEGAEHAGRVLGLPAWLWQLANLVLFFAVLIYFVARPLATAFRNRQLRVEESLKQARERRAEAARFEAEIHERMGRLEREVAEIRAQGAAEGEGERRALLERADQEADRVRRESQAEIERRLEFAKEDLRRTAADLIASSARERVVREITDEDRRRLLSESVDRLESGR
jgi:F-type H+-transporting ATPase subunit b